jgi:hypothetical protein
VAGHQIGEITKYLEAAMKINVKWSDIRDGRAGRTTECMVALALKRELGAEYASVGLGDATALLNGEFVKVYLASDAVKRIRFWDRYHFVLPFRFEAMCAGFLTGRELQPAFPDVVSAGTALGEPVPAGA